MRAMHRPRLAFAFLLCGLIIAAVARAATAPLLTADKPLQVELSENQPVEIAYTHDGNRLVGLRAETDAAAIDIRLDGSAEKDYGAYHVRGSFDWTFRSLTLAASLNVAVSRYHGTDAVPWGLQDLTLSGLARWFVHGPLYVSLSGSIAYSRQAWVWNEGRWAPAIAFAVGAMR